MSYAYHPQIVRQLERMIPSLRDLLRICVWDHLAVWNEILSLVKFTYNNSYYTSIRMTSYEVL